MAQRTPTVYAFMDESGDAGMNVSKGASSFLIIVLVETTDPEALRQAVRDLRARLNLPRTFEFHYHETRMKWARQAFFAMLRSLDLRVRAVVVNKGQLAEQTQGWSERELYQYALGQLVSHIPPEELSEAILVIDGERGKQEFVRALRKHFSELAQAQKRKRVFKAITLKDSDREEGLQYADMIAGLLAEHFEHGKSPHAAAVMDTVKTYLLLPENNTPCLSYS